MESWLTNVFVGFDVVLQSEGAIYRALFDQEKRSSSRVKLLLCRNDPTLCLFDGDLLCESTLDADFFSASPQQLVGLSASVFTASSLVVVVHVAPLVSSVDDIPRWGAALALHRERSLVLVPAAFAKEHVELLAFNALFVGDTFNGWTLLQSRPYTVREANVFDLESLLRLEKFWDSPSLEATESELLRRLSEFPEGQLVLEMHGSIVAVLYSQRISDANALLSTRSYADIPFLALTNGPVLQFLAALSDPDVAQAQPAHSLLQHALNLFSCRGFRTVQAITRWSQFSSWKKERPDRTASDYFALLDKDGLSVDATVRWHQR